MDLEPQSEMAAAFLRDFDLRKGCLRRPFCIAKENRKQEKERKRCKNAFSLLPGLQKQPCSTWKGNHRFHSVFYNKDAL